MGTAWQRSSGQVVGAGPVLVEGGVGCWTGPIAAEDNPAAPRVRRCRRTAPHLHNERPRSSEQQQAKAASRGLGLGWGAGPG